MRNRNRLLLCAGALLLALIAGALLSPAALPDESPICNTDFCRLIAAGSLPELRWPDFSDRRQDLFRLYELSASRPLWVQGPNLTSQAVKIIDVLKNAGSEGLDPQDYDGPQWDGRIAALRNGSISPERFDLALSVSAMRYASSLRFGRANPNGTQGAFRVGDHDADIAAWMFQRLFSASDPKAAFEELDPPFDSYRRLRTILANYEQIAWQDEGEKLPVPDKPVDPGQPYEGVSRLAALLQRIGDLAPSGGAPNSLVYGGALVAAVKRFQLRHGLDSDGRLGAKTVEELNTPLVHRVRQLQLALERMRWLPRDSSQPSIIVNIPEFRLRALSASGKTELEMKVVVGKAQGLQTPSFRADMKYVIFRPYWNVPPSIQRKELVPGIEKDPSYLAKNGYEVTDADGGVVSAGAVSSEVLAGLRDGKLQIRQRPGAKNALGGVKFMLPNPNDVYLHDTPSRRLFSRARRDFSHGCIRLERAADLAVWVLRDRPEWTRDRIEAAMTKRGAPLQVNLSHPIPVLIVYQTAVAGDDGSAYFFDDIYGQDDVLDQQLAIPGFGRLTS